MTQKHTPEPWEVKSPNDVQNMKFIYSQSVSQLVFTILNSERGRADAARIVACVNEFAGKTNEEVKGYVEAMDAMYKNYCNLQAENILLKEQIEKLKEGE